MLLPNKDIEKIRKDYPATAAMMEFCWDSIILIVLYVVIADVRKAIIPKGYSTPVVTNQGVE